MGCRCCICQTVCRAADDIEGFLCAAHWPRVSSDTREAYRKAVRAWKKAKGYPYKGHAWGRMADAMWACKDEARASLNLEDAVPWGSEHRSLLPTSRALYHRSADAPATPPKKSVPDDILAAC